MKKWTIIDVDELSPFIHDAAYFTAACNAHDVTGVKERWIVQYAERQSRPATLLENYENAGLAVLKKLGDRDFFDNLVSKSERSIAIVEGHGYKMNSLEVKITPSDELLSYYKKMFLLWVEMNKWGHIINLIDFEHFSLSNKIMKVLASKKAVLTKQVSVAFAFSTLTTPNKRTKLAQQDFELYAILASIKKSKETCKLFNRPLSEITTRLHEFKDIQNLVDKHVEKYKWLQFQYDGPMVLVKEYFIEALAALAKSKVEPYNKIAGLELAEKNLVAEQKRLVSILELTEEELYWIEVTKTFGYLKALRKEVIFEASCNYYPVLKEIAKRIGTSPRQARFMTIQELTNAINGKIDLQEVTRRASFCVATFENDAVFFTGKTAKKLCENIAERTTNLLEQNEIRGSTAFAGIAFGEVKIVNSASDLAKFSAGNVLVSRATNPNLISAMKIASAIITDDGGITCHAAIVSRELQKPCIIGTKVSTKWLKDGDKVQVDAVHGIVKKIKE